MSIDLSGNALPQLVLSRAQAVARRLHSVAWTDIAVLPVQGGPVRERPLPPAAGWGDSFAPVAPGSYFGPPGGGFGQRFFRVQLPAASPVECGRRFLRWEGAGELTVYQGERALGGFDPNHLHVAVGDEAATLLLDASTCQTWMHPAPRDGGLRPDRNGLRFDCCRLLVRDPLAWSHAWDLTVWAELVEALLPDTRPAKFLNALSRPQLEYGVPAWLRRLLRQLDGICDLIEHEGLPVASAAIRHLHHELPPAAGQDVRAAFCGHAHLDLIHLWPEYQAERKALHTFANILALMDRHPTLTFVQSQPALADRVNCLSPDLARRIGERAAEGRWEWTGGLWVESDLLIPCGEALARGLLHGQKRLRELRGGRPNRVLWLPDSFGFPACLPQMLRQVGIDCFYTQKQGWNQITQPPYSAVRWRSPDGSEVVACLGRISYNGPQNTAALIELAHCQPQADITNEMLVPMGYGDGGGGVSEEMCERVARWASLTGVPASGWERAGEVLGRLAEHAAELPLWQGEIAAEFHRGVATAESRLKHAYRRAECALRDSEAAAVLAGADGPGWEAWDRLLVAQFHDCICGPSLECCIRDMSTELSVLAQTQNARAAELLSGPGGPCLARLLAAPGLGVAEVSSGDLPPGWQEGLCTSDGRRLRVQALDGDRVLVQTVFAGAEVVELRAAPTAAQVGPEAESRRIANERLEARFDATGGLTALCIDGRPVPLAGTGNLVLFHNRPANFDAWDVDQHDLRHGRPCPAEGPLTTEMRGAVRARLGQRLDLGEAGDGHIAWQLDAGEPWLICELDLDWRAAHHLLAWVLPTALRPFAVRYGAPFGSVLRADSPGPPGREAQWLVNGGRWAAMADDDAYGLALVAEASWGFASREGALALALLRGPRNPNPTSDLGRHRLRFALGAVRPGLAGIELPPAAADRLFASTFSLRGTARRPPVTIEDAGTLIPHWLLPDGPGAWILRLHECWGGRGTARLRLSSQGEVECVALDGSLLPGTVPQRSGEQVLLPYLPYQILSLRVRSCPATDPSSSKELEHA